MRDLSPAGMEAKAYVKTKTENALCRFFTRSGKYKVLPYGFSLAKNALGEGGTRDEAWINAANNMKGKEGLAL